MNNRLDELAAQNMLLAIYSFARLARAAARDSLRTIQCVPRIPSTVWRCDWKSPRC